MSNFWYFYVTPQCAHFPTLSINRLMPSFMPVGALLIQWRRFLDCQNLHTRWRILLFRVAFFSNTHFKTCTKFTSLNFIVDGYLKKSDPDFIKNLLAKFTHWKFNLSILKKIEFIFNFLKCFKFPLKSVLYETPNFLLKMEP